MEGGTVMRVLRGLSAAIVVCLLALAAGPVGLATASVTMESSPGGTTTNNTTPTFAGSASDFVDPVTLQVYEGTSAAGSPVRSVEAPAPVTGAWSVTVSPELPDGTYTAVAEQIELGGLGETFKSEPPVTFTVDTAAPAVSLHAVTSPSKDTTPSFTGSASDTTTVTVDIYEGSSAEGTIVSTATAAGTGGGWSSGEASPALPSGTYTARATQPSSLKNAAGFSKSVTFVVSTASPTVSLSSIASPSKDATPSFKGSASDTTTVTVKIYEGTSAEGTVVATATAAGTGGGWSSGEASPALPSGTYTAIATQPSSLGNPDGKSNTVTFVVSTASPSVSLNSIASPSKDTTPSFTGSASDSTTVTVKIYEGNAAEGTVVSTATAAGTGGAWSSGSASPSLASGTYTAVAIQPSSLGNPAGKSNTVTFVVSTASPTVTLNQPKSLSNDTTPSFTGYASDTTQVTVQIYKGTTTEGTPVASATAEGNASNWTSGEAGPPLSNGQYTAIAVQSSSLGNAAGKSNTVTFTVDTSPPSVTLNQPKSPSGNTTPSFTGSASDTETVTIHIYAGSKAEGPPVSNAAANGTGSGWSSGQASPALASGQYTAVAVQPSSLGNSPGSSSPVTFVVDTSSPTVTLNQPPSPSKDTTPPFSGNASDTTKVVVHIYDSKSVEVAAATANGNGGAWSTENEPALASGSYTATATQESSLGNPAGVSNQVAFTVNTAPPTVTLNSPALRSNNTTPSFTGTGSDTTLVTVKVYPGTNTEGTAVSTASAAGTGGGWTSGTVSPALPNGQYSAVAYQPSSLGNATGKSVAVTFTVDTNSPTVTLSQPTSPSNVTAPSFTGTATEGTPAEPSAVTVRIYAGKTATGSVLATALAEGTGGAWTSGPATPALPRGTYTATATQASSIGNSPGTSAPVTFVVETESPKVTLNPLAKPLSNNTQPSFTGAASDTTAVTVRIYAGSKAEGIPVSNAAAAGTGGPWNSEPATPALVSGQYTAVAVQLSSAGNAPGESKPITFTVNTASPTVALAQPNSPSNNTKPTFTGTATDSTPVVVHVFNSASLEVTKATATPSHGTFTAGNEGALTDGTYTATASQQSSLGNPPGSSSQVTFVVNTAPPTVTLSTPPSPSNDRTPSFTGSASDSTAVTVKIWVGSKPSGSPIATATATPVAGGWASTAAAPALPNVQHSYTAIATEESSIGNPTGASAPIHFEVDPAAPTVVLNAPPSRTNNATPSFTGSASDIGPISIEIFAGANVEGKPKAVSTATATGTRGAWTSGPAGPPLPDGAYTVLASQHNSVIVEEVGTSERFSFILDTVAPAVTLTTPANGSSTASGSEAVGGSLGTQEGDLPHVTARLFSGATVAAGQAPLQSITVNANASAWSGAFGGLTPGTYTVRAEQLDAAGNVGVSPTSTFVVTGPSSVAHSSPAAPAASFTWFPASPRVGQAVSLISSSTDSASPITGFAWDPAGTGAFASGGPTTSTIFSSAGNHKVQLRVTDANGISSVASELIPVSASLPLMQPFPVVRIAGTGTRSGIKLSQLSVLASAGTQITVQCRGRRCPVKPQTVRVQSHVAKTGKRLSPAVEFRRFERSFAAGLVLEIRVSRAGMTGKYTRFVVRRGKLPLRFDACLTGVEVKPVGCPS